MSIRPQPFYLAKNIPNSEILLAALILTENHHIDSFLYENILNTKPIKTKFVGQNKWMRKGRQTDSQTVRQTNRIIDRYTSIHKWVGEQTRQLNECRKPSYGWMSVCV